MKKWKDIKNFKLVKNNLYQVSYSEVTNIALKRNLTVSVREFGKGNIFKELS